MSFAQRVFVEWGLMVGTTSSYTAMLLRGELPAVEEAGEEAVDEAAYKAADEAANQELEDDLNDMGPVSGPKVLSSVQLAHTAHRF
jgi:hypothetical protein